MISVIYIKHGLRVNAIWFCSDTSEVINQSKADFIFLHGVRSNIFKNSIVNSQHTLITNLEETSEDIFKQISKNCRYEINRAKKENIECVVLEADALKRNPVMLSTFKREYDDFTRLKGIPNTYNEGAMDKYIENGNVILTKAFKGDEDYAQHIYVSDKKNARLLYSVSKFRTEGLDRNLIGRANKYLHWNDIQYLQSHSFQLLDWGGLSSLTDPNGVDKFKKEFGGYEDQYYNIIVGKSLIGRLVVLVKKIIRG
jgi:hypothetical protein